MESEYEIQWFGFSVEQFQKEVRLLIQTDVEDLVNGLAKSLINHPSVDAKKAQTIRSNVGTVTENIVQSSAPVLTKLDECIKNAFSIEDFVLLPEDRLKAKHIYTEEDEKILQERLDQLNLNYKQVSGRFPIQFFQSELLKELLFVFRIFNL